ncbi:hypothetical protein THASP1DRAFT_4002, partial [Thamnocephalis sphaerospora]
QRPATFEELGEARITRDMLEKWAHAPFFEQAVTGAFARIGIGQGPDGQMVYRICCVQGVEEYPRPYQFGNTTTNLALRCSHGKAIKLFRMDIVSNGAFTQREYDRYMGTLHHERQNIATSTDVQRKRDDFE